MRHRLTHYYSLIESEGTDGFNQSYFDALATGRELAATNGIDAALKTHNLTALILPAPGFSFIPSGMRKSVNLYDRADSDLLQRSRAIQLSRFPSTFIRKMSRSNPPVL